MSRFTRIGLVSLFAIAVGGIFIHAAQDKKPTAEAEIVVINRESAKKTGAGFEGDYLTTQTQLLSSRIIAQQAVKQGQLDRLESLKGKDAEAEVVKAIKVERSTNPVNNPTLKVSIIGLPKQDAVVVLEAVLTAYQQHIKEVFEDLSENLVKTIRQTSKELDEKIRTADEDIKKFYENSPYMISKSGSPVAKQTLALTTEQLAKVEVEHGDVAVRLQTLSEAAKHPDMSDAVKTKAREWGKSVGLEPAGSTVEAYLGSMRLDLLILAKRREQLQDSSSKLTGEMRAVIANETKQFQLQDARARAVSQHADIQRLIQNADLKSARGFHVAVITKPHVVE